MNIIQVAPYFFPYQGGQERHVYNLSKELRKRNHNVMVLTSNYPSTKEEEVLDGITILRHKCFLRLLRNPISPTLLTRFKQLNEFDIIHTHNEHSFSSLIAVLFKWYSKKPLVITCHGQLKFNNKLKDLFEYHYNRTFGKVVFNTADCIIALSESDKEYISSLNVNPKKIRVVPNAINTSNFVITVNHSDYNHFLDQFDLRNKTIILFVGPVISRKGVQYLLDCVPEVVSQFKDIVFLIVGSGDYLNEAIQQSYRLGIEEYVRFTGSITETELLYSYNSAHIFVLPSISEGLPTTILEAFTYSLPVISTDIPGVRDYFKDYALLVQPQNSEELASALKTLLDNPALVAELGSIGKSLVNSKFTWDIVSMQIEDMYYELIKLEKCGLENETLLT